MVVQFNVTGEQRKALVQAISELTGNPAVYVSGNGRSFAIGDLLVDKDGNLDHSKHDGFIYPLLHALAGIGFPCARQGGDNAPSEEQNVLSIEVPLEGFTETTLGNLEKLVLAKATLIKNAIGVNALPIERTESTLRFPWFRADASPEEVEAYTTFVGQLCITAKTLKRVTASERDVENKKYAFRCFLLKLGFIGDKFKAARKILLGKLDGDSAYAK